MRLTLSRCAVADTEADANMTLRAKLPPEIAASIQACRAFEIAPGFFGVTFTIDAGERSPAAVRQLAPLFHVSVTKGSQS